MSDSSLNSIARVCRSSRNETIAALFVFVGNADTQLNEGTIRLGLRCTGQPCYPSPPYKETVMAKETKNPTVAPRVLTELHQLRASAPGADAAARLKAIAADLDGDDADTEKAR